ncbi:MAG: thiamine phosphate synthase [Acetatifactor sp.]
MNCDKEMMRLYAVTDRAWTGRQTLYEQVEEALQHGATFIQLREKKLDEEAFLAEAKELKKLCQVYGVPFVINDNVEIALACDADGVHVGQEDMQAGEVRAKLGPDKIIGVSAHSVEEALAAVKNGADYLGVGAVFGTATKTDVTAMSYETLRAICDAVEVPVVAIGGIQEDNIDKLTGSGVDGVAVVSAIFGAENIGRATERLRQASDRMVESREEADEDSIVNRGK